jgi:hypothetical protein
VCKKQKADKKRRKMQKKREIRGNVRENGKQMGTGNRNAK